MNTRLSTQHRLMIITVVAGLILAVIALLKPVAAEAGVTVTARVGQVGVAVSTEAPRGVIVQTGPRTYRYEACRRPARPLRGHYVWVPGHYEKLLVKGNCRKTHQSGKFRPGKGKTRRTKLDHMVKGKRGRKAPRHDHFREVWVPGRWERI